MSINELLILEKYGGSIDEAKKRIYIPLGAGSSITAYFPTAGMQIFFYNIHGGAKLPDMKLLGLREEIDERYLSTTICKSGKCEFIKGSKSAYLLAGEAAMDYGEQSDGSFNFTAEDYVGVEIFMKIDSVIHEMPMISSLKMIVKKMSLKEAEIKNNDFMYCFGISTKTETTLDELLKYDKESADATIVMIKAAEIGHNLGTDLMQAQSNTRSFVSSTQARIAADIRNTIQENYGEKFTAEMFAEKYNLSTTTVKNYFKMIYGYGYKEYHTKVRMEKAAEFLRNTKLSVGDISHKVGYKSQAKFGQVFKKTYGVTPLEYRVTSRLDNI